MTNQVTAQAIAQIDTSADSSIAAIGTALLAGVFLLFIAGYAQATALHDAAHDQRHAMAFPCH